ncbi:hypothetical protein VP01_3778g3 [Puccinia sorghi]|uniref:Uncharacterized protein n=1 Tax=Puccinia sorghi TaxID=27349 RepID=A0A0L6UVK7_9BASI|nr:hypothetical protein VP01_3778g3 [Puccinia sorghi]
MMMDHCWLRLKGTSKNWAEPRSLTCDIAFLKNPDDSLQFKDRNKNLGDKGFTEVRWAEAMEKYDLYFMLPEEVESDSEDNDDGSDALSIDFANTSGEDDNDRDSEDEDQRTDENYEEFDDENMEDVGQGLYMLACVIMSGMLGNDSMCQRSCIP